MPLLDAVHQGSEALFERGCAACFQSGKEAIDAEVLAGTVFGFVEAIGAEVEAVAGREVDGLLFVNGMGENADGDAGGVADERRGTGAEVDGAEVSGGDITEVAGLFVQDAVEHREIAGHGGVGGKLPVEAGDDFGGRGHGEATGAVRGGVVEEGAVRGSRKHVGEGDGEECGGDAVTGDIEDVNGEVLVVEGEDVEGVTADVDAGKGAVGEEEPGEAGEVGREQSLLGLGGGFKILLDDPGGRFEVAVGDEQGLLGFNLRGDVRLNADEVGDETGFIADGGDGKAVPERGAVLAVVEQLDGDFPLLADGAPEEVDGGGVGFGALEEAAVAAEDFGDGIAGEPLKAGVDVDERLVGQAGVGDGDAFGTGGEGTVLQFELRLGFLLVEQPWGESLRCGRDHRRCLCSILLRLAGTGGGGSFHRPGRSGLERKGWSEQRTKPGEKQGGRVGLVP